MRSRRRLEAATTGSRSPPGPPLTGPLWEQNCEQDKSGCELARESAFSWSPAQAKERGDAHRADSKNCRECLTMCRPRESRRRSGNWTSAGCRTMFTRWAPRASPAHQHGRNRTSANPDSTPCGTRRNEARGHRASRPQNSGPKRRLITATLGRSSKWNRAPESAFSTKDSLIA